MHCIRDFDIADPGEDEFYGIDFVNDLQAGDSISSATINFTLKSGADPSPASHVIGSYFIINGSAGAPTVVSQRIRGLLAGNVYILQIIAVTSSGAGISLFSYIPCQAVY